MHSLKVSTSCSPDSSMWSITARILGTISEWPQSFNRKYTDFDMFPQTHWSVKSFLLPRGIITFQTDVWSPSCSSTLKESLKAFKLLRQDKYDLLFIHAYIWIRSFCKCPGIAFGKLESDIIEESSKKSMESGLLLNSLLINSSENTGREPTPGQAVAWWRGRVRQCRVHAQTRWSWLSTVRWGSNLSGGSSVVVPLLPLVGTANDKSSPMGMHFLWQKAAYSAESWSGAHSREYRMEETWVRPALANHCQPPICPAWPYLGPVLS